MGGGEILLAVVLVLILFSAGILVSPTVATRKQVLDEFMVWVAQGFGVGRVPFAPGTLGSVVGCLWFALLLTAGRYWVLALGILVGLALSVWLCGVAEKILGRKDPSSVVLDEVAVMPVCFLAWVGLVARSGGAWPGFDYFLSGRNLPLTLAVFAGFRLFDIWKPWPARQSQALPAGWGITVDDLIAAVYVNFTALIIHAARVVMGK